MLLTDITYIYYNSGKCAYLSTIKDGCTKQIPAYCLSKDMTTSIVTNTIDVLRKNRIYQLHLDALFNSDQGIQYKSLILKEEIDSFIEYYNNFRYRL